MAKEEFYKEMSGEVTIHRIKGADELTGQEPQIVIMDNETPEALAAALAKIDSNRVLFVKNFETLPKELRKELLERKSLVIAGDLENVLLKDEVLTFQAQVFFSAFPGIAMPILEQYEGFVAPDGRARVI